MVYYMYWPQQMLANDVLHFVRCLAQMSSE